MIETALNVVWLAVALAATLAWPRCTPRTRIALACCVALLFPIISISDDFNANSSLTDAMALLVVVVIAVLMIATRHVQSIAAPALAIVTHTPSDPRSPPR